jgi:protease IV
VYRLPNDNHWGGNKKIALIYALGECAMDQGITARKLVKDVESAVNDPFVSAIVFRVDSPGGDGMASDIVAEALRKGKGKKPIIVSQGAVAASGGYWLSMYADTIVAAPNTLTGSVGVIGGWYYNKELKEKLGMTTDFVKTGNHADLGFGMTLPLIGLGLPDRNLTAEERTVMERSIKSMYKDFVQKVATGRHKKTEEIDAIAEGHIFSGTEGSTNGLVDVLGGLSEAIRIARERAGIATNERIDIVELPKQGLFNLNLFSPKLFGIDVQQKDPVIESLLFRFRHNGQPLPMVPLEEIDN